MLTKAEQHDRFFQTFRQFWNALIFTDPDTFLLLADANHPANREFTELESKMKTIVEDY
jgi:hypothetical protein